MKQFCSREARSSRPGISPQLAAASRVDTALRLVLLSQMTPLLTLLACHMSPGDTFVLLLVPVHHSVRLPDDEACVPQSAALGNVFCISSSYTGNI